MATPSSKPELAPVKYEEDHGSRLWRKSKEAPFVPLGIVGLLAACGIGAYQYKNRGKMSTSLYLMQLRVVAQSMVVGAMTIGVGYSIFSDYMKKKAPKDT